MPRTVDPPAPPEATPHRKRWTRRECDFLRESRLLVGRYELVDGEVIDKTGQKPPHASAIVLVHAWLAGIFGPLYLRVQLPIQVAPPDEETNEPEPDVVVTTRAVSAYTQAHPAPQDLLLVVEVSDTTLDFDRSKKALLYSRSGVREYWVLDLVGRQLFVHREPTPHRYADIRVYSAEERVAPLARPDAVIQVGDLLPAA